MDLLLYLFFIFLGSAIPLIEYMLTIPFGIIAGLPSIPVVIAAFFGNLLGVLLIILFVDKVKTLLRKRRERKQYVFEKNAAEEKQQISENPEEDQQSIKSLSEIREERKKKREERAKKLWDKYGVAGLSFFGTILLSSHITAMMACTFGGNRGYVMLWMTISLAFWSIATGIVFHFGMDIFFG